MKQHEPADSSEEWPHEILTIQRKYNLFKHAAKVGLPSDLISTAGERGKGHGKKA